MSAQSLGILPFPIIIDNEVKGEIDVLINDVEGMMVSSSQLRTLLLPILSEDSQLALKNLPEWVSEEQLQDNGIDIRIDEAALQVAVTISPKQKAVRYISLKSGVAETYTDILSVSDFSFYINMEARGDIDYSLNPDTPYQSSNLSATLKPVFNYRGLILEGNISLDADQVDPFSLNSISLLKDFEESNLRLTIGSYNPSLMMFQSSNASDFGIHITNRHQSQADFSSFVQRNLFLSDQSLVEVLVNNKLQKSMYLPSGRYVISDFYLTQGINEIALQVTPSNGDASWEDTYRTGYDSKLLPVGDQRFAYSIGYRLDELDFFSSPVLTGMHSLGISPTLSLGAGIQADLSEQQLTAEAVWVTGIGTFNGAAALSRNTSGDFGSAVQASYSVSHPDIPRISLSGTYYSDSYTAFGAENVNRSPVLSGTVNTGISLTDSIGLSGSYTINAKRSTYALDMRGSLRLSGKLSDSLSLSAGANASWDGADTAWSGSVSLTYRPTSQSTVSTSTDITSGSSSINFSTTPKAWNNAGTISVSASGIDIDDPLPDTISATGSYRGQLATISVSQQIQPAIFSQSGIYTSFNTAATLSTSFAYADGLFGMSRPISDSFVIVAEKQKHKDVTLGIRTSSKTIDTTDNIFNTVVVQNITSRHNNRISVDVVDMPPGYDPGKTNITVNPAYKQGAAFTVGSKAVVYATGRLLFSDGVPAALILGSVRNLDDPKAEEILIFTDENGEFFIYGLTEGSYLITMYQAGWDDYFLDITPGMNGLLEIGDVELSVSSESLNTANTITDTFAHATIIQDTTYPSDDENVTPADDTVSTATLNPEKDIYGKLLFDDNTPVAFCNASIVKVLDNAFETVSFTTDLDGQFKLEDLKPGEYEITFFFLEELTYTLKVPNNSNEESLAVEYRINNTAAINTEENPPASRDAQAESEENVNNFAIEQPTSVPVSEEPTLIIDQTARIQIVSADGLPIPYLNGSYVNVDTAAYIQDVTFFSTDADGYLLIDNLAAGTYRIELLYFDLLEYEIDLQNTGTSVGVEQGYVLTLDDMITI